MHAKWHSHMCVQVCVCECRQMYLYLQYNLKANKPHNQTRRNYWQITKSTNRRTINQHQQIKMSAGIKQHLLFTIRLNNDEWITQLSRVEQSWAEPRLQPAQQQQQQPTSSSRKESTRKLLATDWVRQRVSEKGHRGRDRVFPATFRDYVQITAMAVASLNCLSFEYGLVFVVLFEFRLFSFGSFGLWLKLNFTENSVCSLFKTFSQILHNPTTRRASKLIRKTKEYNLVYFPTPLLVLHFNNSKISLWTFSNWR